MTRACSSSATLDTGPQPRTPTGLNGPGDSGCDAAPGGSHFLQRANLDPCGVRLGGRQAASHRAYRGMPALALKPAGLESICANAEAREQSERRWQDDSEGTENELRAAAVLLLRAANELRLPAGSSRSPTAKRA
jgi:hypothetical protein